MSDAATTPALLQPKKRTVSKIPKIKTTTTTTVVKRRKTDKPVFQVSSDDLEVLHFKPATPTTSAVSFMFCSHVLALDLPAVEVAAVFDGAVYNKSYNTLLLPLTEEVAAQVTRLESRMFVEVGAAARGWALRSSLSDDGCLRVVPTKPFAFTTPDSERTHPWNSILKDTVVGVELICHGAWATNKECGLSFRPVKGSFIESKAETEASMQIASQEP
jgi:hypothetical protein